MLSYLVFLQRLVQMNMRYYRDGTVDYTATFFALVRTGLQIYTVDGAFFFFCFLLFFYNLRFAKIC
jgi:hypothetical protein